MHDTNGWAVVQDGDIDVFTVSQTRRFAMINWLTAYHGLRMTHEMSDQDIERMWEQKHGRAELKIVDISISGAQLQ